MSTQEAARPVEPVAPAARGGRRAGWRVALRSARREVLRAKGRSALVLLLVMLPVVVISGLSTALHTTDISKIEALPRQLGTADASIGLRGAEPGAMPPERIVQCPDNTCTQSYPSPDAAVAQPSPIAAMKSVLGPDIRIVAFPSQGTDVEFGDLRFPSEIAEADLTDPTFRGMLTLVSGRAPDKPGEVAVSQAIAGRGAGIGTRVDLSRYGKATVVGIVESLRAKDDVIGAPGGLGLPAVEGDRLGGNGLWLVSNTGGVTWPQILELNALGLVATSREVITNPPTPAELQSNPLTATLSMAMESSNTNQLTVVALGVAMILLEVILLAGPAFAVGAASQTRALGLLATQGGTRRHMRLFVLAQAVLLGGVAAVLGALIGVLGLRLAYPLLKQTIPVTALGPFEVSWPEVLIVAALGFASAVLAALAPARAASRMNPVAAIAGRRPGARIRGRHPLIGVLLLGPALALAYTGSVGYYADRQGGELLIAASAIAAVIGVIMFAPSAVRATASLAGSAPLSLRYAVRDMARNQLRTAPAIAAVAAVVAGAVALGISGSSDSEQSRAQYAGRGPVGDALVRLGDQQGRIVSEDSWDRVAASLASTIPGADVRRVPALEDPYTGDANKTPPLVLTESSVLPDQPGQIYAGKAQLQAANARWYPKSILVGAEGLDAASPALTPEQAARAGEALVQGSVVVLRNSSGSDQGTATFHLVKDPGNLEPDSINGVPSFARPAIGLQVRGTSTPALAIIPESLASDAQASVVTSSLIVDDAADLTRTQEELLNAALNRSTTAVNPELYGFLEIERGWNNELRLPLLLLAGGAAVLVVGGSLTAALLALSDARPDFATLGAIGAAPRTRRRISGAYGTVIALLGALLGAAAGFIPGIGITYPLTRNGQPSSGQVDLEGNPILDHYLVIPWPVIAGLVIGLPILVGLITMALTRAKLPMAGRLD